MDLVGLRLAINSNGRMLLQDGPHVLLYHPEADSSGGTIERDSGDSTCEVHIAAVLGQCFICSSPTHNRKPIRGAFRGRIRSTKAHSKDPPGPQWLGITREVTGSTVKKKGLKLWRVMPSCTLEQENTALD